MSLFSKTRSIVSLHSSRDKGTPFTVSIGTGAVIKAWEEAVPGMLPGEVRKLTVPPSAGYGALGREPSIPPNATLHFEIELIKQVDPKHHEPTSPDDDLLARDAVPLKQAEKQP